MSEHSWQEQNLNFEELPEDALHHESPDFGETQYEAPEYQSPLQMRSRSRSRRHTGGVRGWWSRVTAGIQMQVATFQEYVANVVYEVQQFSEAVATNLRSVAVLVLAFGIPATLAVLITVTPVFTISEVTIHAPDPLTPVQADLIRQIEGRKLPFIAAQPVIEAIGRDPWVAGVSFRRVLPNKVVVSWERSIPVLAVNGLLVDGDGKVLGNVPPAEREGLPTLYLEDVESTTVEWGKKLEHPGVDAALALLSRPEAEELKASLLRYDEQFGLSIESGTTAMGAASSSPAKEAWAAAEWEGPEWYTESRVVVEENLPLEANAASEETFEAHFAHSQSQSTQPQSLSAVSQQTSSQEDGEK